VQPDLGGARTRRRTGRSAGRARVPGPPSHHRATHPTCYLEDLYAAKQWGGGDVANRLIAAVYASDGFGPASSPRSTTPRHAPYTTPSPIGHRFGIPALSLPEDSARCGRRRRLPRPIRCAAHKRRSPYLPASPVHWSTPERESQRQGRCNSLTKINAGLHGAAGASARRLADMTCLGARFDLACAHGPAGPVSRSPWSVAGSAGSINQYASRQYAKGVAGRAPRCDRQRSWRSLRDRRTTGFPQIRAVRAVWRPFWLDGNACGQREGE
jgi:hypothetical protein